MWELLYKNVNGKDTKKKPSDASIIFFVEEFKGMVSVEGTAEICP